MPESARSAEAWSGTEAVTEAALHFHKSLVGAHLQPEELLYPQQQLQTLLGLVLCSLKTHNGWEPNPSCCPKRVRFSSGGRMTAEKSKKCRSEELLFCFRSIRSSANMLSWKAANPSWVPVQV